MCESTHDSIEKQPFAAEPPRQRRVQVSAADEYGLKAESSSLTVHGDRGRAQYLFTRQKDGQRAALVSLQDPIN